MRFTFGRVAVHFRECCGPLLFKKKLKKDNKNFCEKVYVRQKDIMKFTWLPATVQFSVWSSAFFCPMKYTRWFWSREKQSVRFSVNLKLLLNRKELERVFYMKKLRLVDISNGISFESFRQADCKKITKNHRCHSTSAAPFSKLT